MSDYELLKRFSLTTKLMLIFGLPLAGMSMVMIFRQVDTTAVFVGLASVVVLTIACFYPGVQSGFLEKARSEIELIQARPESEATLVKLLSLITGLAMIGLLYFLITEGIQVSPRTLTYSILLPLFLTFTLGVFCKSKIARQINLNNFTNTPV